VGYFEQFGEAGLVEDELEGAGWVAEGDLRLLGYYFVRHVAVAVDGDPGVERNAELCFHEAGIYVDVPVSTIWMHRRID
jgi:hypothetical protein